MTKIDYGKAYLREQGKVPEIRYGNQCYYVIRGNHTWRESSVHEAAQFVHGQLPVEAKKASIVRTILEGIKMDNRFTFPKIDFPHRHCVITAEGKLDLDTLTVNEIQDTDFETNFINFKFKRNADWKEAVNFVNYLKTSLGIDLLAGRKDDDRRKLLMEILTYAVSDLYGAKKMIILLGPSHTGKTVLLNLLRFVVGPQGYTPLSLSDLSDRFRNAALLRAPLILNDELGERGLKNLDIIKKIVSGEPMIVEMKGKTPECCIPHAKVIFAANSLPLLTEYDAEHAFANRLQILKFKKSLDRKKWDIKLTEKIIAERNVIFSKAIMESREFVNDLIFTDDPDSKELLANFRKENSTVQSFAEDRLVDLNDRQDGEYTMDLYENYEEYCKSECLRPLNKRSFRSVLAQMGYSLSKKRLDDDRTPRSCVLGIKIKPEFK